MSGRSKRTLYSLTTLILLTSASLGHAAAGRDFYFTGFKGLNVNAYNEKPQGNLPAHQGRFAGAMGFQLNASWRVESEVSLTERSPSYRDEYESAPVERSKDMMGLLNVYHDFETAGKLKPFIGGGVGIVSEEAASKSIQNTGGFAWQLGGGLRYTFDPSLSFSSAYRYLGSAEENAQEGHALRMGLNYKLPLRPRHHPRGLNDTGQ